MLQHFIFRLSILTALIAFASGCAGVHLSGLEKPQKEPALVNISNGLPSDGLWRQNIALEDMNKDGFLDIVAPPPRKSKDIMKSPALFIWDNGGNVWKYGHLELPPLPDYGYGGVATGDLNGDSMPDIVFAVHTGKIVVLYNSGDGKFIKTDFPVAKEFHSRAVALDDINNNGWTDIVAVSEGPFISSYKPAGILTGINRIGLGWDTTFVEGSGGIYSDSLALGDVNGDGNTDIVIVPFSDRKHEGYVWFGDGLGGFVNLKDQDLAIDAEIAAVAAGDIDGDGASELAINVVSILQPGDILVREMLVFKWTDGRFENVSSGLGSLRNVNVFTLADICGDGKHELVVLSDGLSVYKYFDTGWVRRFYLPIGAYEETAGAFGIRAGRNSDGSALIVYNLGSEDVKLKSGIRAYMIPAEYLLD